MLLNIKETGSNKNKFKNRRNYFEFSIRPATLRSLSLVPSNVLPWLPSLRQISLNINLFF